MNRTSIRKLLGFWGGGPAIAAFVVLIYGMRLWYLHGRVVNPPECAFIAVIVTAGVTAISRLPDEMNTLKVLLVISIGDAMIGAAVRDVLFSDPGIWLIRMMVNLMLSVLIAGAWSAVQSFRR